MTDIKALQTAGKYFRLSLVRELLPEHRCASCLRIIKYGRDSVDVMHNPEYMTARFNGVVPCGNGWVCPVCAARLSEKRAVALKNGLQAHPEISPMLATFTMSHHMGTPLKFAMAQIKDAYRRMTQSRGFRDFCQEYDWQSSITSTEVTYGRNGWHPHFHTLGLLLTSQDDVSADNMRAELSLLWQTALLQAGGYANDENGTTLKNRTYTIAEYVAKFGHDPVETEGRETWGIDRELTKAISKVGRSAESLTPQQILICSQGDRASEAGKLYQEFAEATRNQKQLTISAKAKQMLQINLPDSEVAICESADESEILLARLSRQQWKMVLHPIDLRPDVIAIASTGNAESLDRFLSSLKTDNLSTMLDSGKK